MAKKEKNSPLGGILRDFIKHNKLQVGIDRVEARDAWERVMGPGVNQYTRTVELRQQTLYVSLASSVLREELSHGRSKIIQMLNEELGRDIIRQLVLR